MRVMMTVGLLCLLLGAGSASAVPAIYVHNGTDLYSVDSTTGSATVIGNNGITISEMAHNPVTGEIWAVGFDGVNKLYTIDTSNGAATLQVSAPSVFGKDFAFRSDGTLFAMNSNTSTVDTSLGTLSLLGPNGLGYGGLGSSFDSSDNLRISSFSNFYLINQSNGSASAPLTLSGPGFDALCGGRLEAADLDEESGDIFGIARSGGGDPYVCFDTVVDYLVRIDPTTGATSVIGPLGVVSGTLVAVPEPTGILAIGCGGLLLAALQRRRRAV